jgi:hypothetical protein
MGSNTPKASRGRRVAALQSLVDGLTAHAEKLPLVNICGRAMTPQELVDRLNVIIAVSGYVERSREEWVAAVRADLAAHQSAESFLSTVRLAVRVAAGRSHDLLADFGLTPRKVPIITQEQRLAWGAKAKAARMRKGRGVGQ